MFEAEVENTGVTTLARTWEEAGAELERPTLQGSLRVPARRPNSLSPVTAFRVLTWSQTRRSSRISVSVQSSPRRSTPRSSLRSRLSRD